MRPGLRRRSSSLVSRKGNSSDLERSSAGTVYDQPLGLQRPQGAVRQLHAEALARGLEHPGADGHLDRDHARRTASPSIRSGPSITRSHRACTPTCESTARPRRLAGALRAGRGGRHPRARHADLARREVIGLHAGDRAAVRQLVAAERARPVRLLRQGRRLPHHRQRGRREALRDEHPLLAAAPRLRHPAAGRCGLDRRGRPRPVVPRRRIRRA